MPLDNSYRVILADCDTRVVPGGNHSLSNAQSEASAYLKARIAHAGHETPAKLARLRLALMRITSHDFKGDL